MKKNMAQILRVEQSFFFIILFCPGYVAIADIKMDMKRTFQRRTVTRRTFQQITDHLIDRSFKRLFRMSRESFSVLFDIVRRDISSYGDDNLSEETGTHISGNCTQIEIQLAVFLRVLAGGDPLDISLAFDVGESNVNKYFHVCMKAVNNRLKLAPIPCTEDICRNSALRFATSRPYLNPLPGCVGAIDVISIMLQNSGIFTVLQNFTAGNATMHLRPKVLSMRTTDLLRFQLLVVDLRKTQPH